jgi:hypothetical protein
MTGTFAHRMTVNTDGKAPDTLANALAAVAESDLRPRFDGITRSVVFGRPAWDPYFGAKMTDATLMLLRELLIVRFSHLSYSPSKSNVFEAVMTLSYKDRINPASGLTISWRDAR